MSHQSTAIAAKRPTFLFIGADRSGSKSLHQIFRQHPECFVPAIADPLFFDCNYDRGMDWYLSLFDSAPSTVRAIGEFSHDYIHSADAAHRIAEDLPDVKILATLRHPIDRLFSSYASAANAGVIRVPLEQALEEVPSLIERSNYADRLAPYFDLFPRDRIKVLYFEDLEADPRAFASEAFRHVGLKAVDGIDYGRRMSPLSRGRWPGAGPATKLGSYVLRRAGWVNLLGKLKSNPTFRGMFYKPYQAGERPQIAEATRRRLREVFAPQIDRLEVMLQRDLTAWRM